MKTLVTRLFALTLMASCSIAVAANVLDEALKRYYAGQPDKAIAMIEPRALAGDTDAQLLLGNILYSLSATGDYDLVDKSLEWYEMAAARNSAAAHHAIGVIHQNKWTDSRDKTDAATAMVYYRNAVALGDPNAQLQLTKIQSQSGLSPQEAVALVARREAPLAASTSAGAAAAEPEVTSQAAAESAAASVATNLEVVSPADDTSTAASTNQAAATESAAAPEVQDQSASIASIPASSVAVTLADIAVQCQNLTELGYALYADTIRGAALSGNATVVARLASDSQAGAYSIDLSNSQFAGTVSVNLLEVPESAAGEFEKGANHAVTGTVVDSKLDGSKCTVSAIYQPPPG